MLSSWRVIASRFEQSNYQELNSLSTGRKPFNRSRRVLITETPIFIGFLNTLNPFKLFQILKKTKCFCHRIILPFSRWLQGVKFAIVASGGLTKLAAFEGKMSIGLTVSGLVRVTIYYTRSGHSDPSLYTR